MDVYLYAWNITVVVVALLFSVDVFIIGRRTQGRRAVALCARAQRTTYRDDRWAAVTLTGSNRGAGIPDARRRRI